MEEENINSHPDLFTSIKDLEATPEELEQPVGTMPTKWPMLPGSQESSLSASSIQPGLQITTAQQHYKGKTVEEHEMDRVSKYAPYFQGNTTLPIPDLVVAMKPKTLSLIVN